MQSSQKIPSLVVDMYMYGRGPAVCLIYAAKKLFYGFAALGNAALFIVSGL